MNSRISKNKALEIIVWEKGWRCVLDFNIEWTTKSSRRDHWGVTLYLVVFGQKLFDFRLYDIRRSDLDNNTAEEK